MITFAEVIPLWLPWAERREVNIWKKVQGGLIPRYDGMPD